MPTRLASLAQLGFPDYEAGTDGRIRSRPRPGLPPDGAILVPRPGSGGLVVELRDRRGEKRGRGLARLILTAFRGPPPGNPHQWQVRYGDGDRTNCRLSNLAWELKSQDGGRERIMARERAIARVRRLVVKYGITPTELRD